MQSGGREPNTCNLYMAKQEGGIHSAYGCRGFGRVAEMSSAAAGLPPSRYRLRQRSIADGSQLRSRLHLSARCSGCACGLVRWSLSGVPGAGGWRLLAVCGLRRGARATCARARSGYETNVDEYLRSPHPIIYPTLRAIGLLPWQRKTHSLHTQIGIAIRIGRLIRTGTDDRPSAVFLSADGSCEAAWTDL